MQGTNAFRPRGLVFETFPDKLSERAREHSLHYRIEQHPVIGYNANNLPRRPVGACHETVSVFPVLPLLSTEPISSVFLPHSPCFSNADSTVRKLIEDEDLDPQYDYYRSQIPQLPTRPYKSTTLNFRRMNEGEGLGEAMGRVHALPYQTSTRLEMVAAVAAPKEEVNGSSVLEHVILRVRRVTAVFLDDNVDLGIDFEDMVYQYTIAQFLDQRTGPCEYDEHFDESHDSHRMWWLHLWNQLWSITLQDALRVRARARHQGLNLPPPMWRRTQSNEEIPHLAKLYVQIMHQTKLSSTKKTDQCPICLEGYGNEEPAVVTDCPSRHVFGASCLCKWIGPELGPKTCPLCRGKLRNAEVYMPWEWDWDDPWPAAALLEHFGIALGFDEDVAAEASIKYFAANPCAGVLGQLPSYQEPFERLMRYDNKSRSLPEIRWDKIDELIWDFDYSHRYRRTIILALQLRRALVRLQDGELYIHAGGALASLSVVPLVFETADYVWSKRESGAWKLRSFELMDKFSSFRPDIDLVYGINDSLTVHDRLSYHCLNMWSQMRRQRLAFEGLNRVLASTEDLWKVLDLFPGRDEDQDEEYLGTALPKFLSALVVPELATRLRRVEDARKIPTEDPWLWAAALSEIIIECNLEPPALEDEDEPGVRGPDEHTARESASDEDQLDEDLFSDTPQLDPLIDGCPCMEWPLDDENTPEGAPRGNFYELIWLCLGMQPCNDAIMEQRYRALHSAWDECGWLPALTAMKPSRNFILRRAEELYTITQTLLDDPAMCEPPFYHIIATYSASLGMLVASIKDKSVKDQLWMLNFIWKDLNAFLRGMSGLDMSILILGKAEHTETGPHDRLLDDVVRHMNAEWREPTHTSFPWYEQYLNNKVATHPNPLRCEETFVWLELRLEGNIYWEYRNIQQPVKVKGLFRYMRAMCMAPRWLLMRGGKVLTEADGMMYGLDDEEKEERREEGVVARPVGEYMELLFARLPRDGRLLRLCWL